MLDISKVGWEDDVLINFNGIEYHMEDTTLGCYMNNRVSRKVGI